jgi:hypothetical protein
MLAFVTGGLGPGGAVVDTGSRYGFGSGDIELSNGYPGRDYHRSARELGSIGKRHHPIGIADADADHFLG